MAQSTTGAHGLLGCSPSVNLVLAHFVELQADDDWGLWVMVHSDSLGLGPAVMDHWVHRKGAISAQDKVTRARLITLLARRIRPGLSLMGVQGLSVRQWLSAFLPCSM